MVSFLVAVCKYSSDGLQEKVSIHSFVSQITYQSTGGLLIGRCFGAMEIVKELFEPRLNKSKQMKHVLSVRASVISIDGERKRDADSITHLRLNKSDVGAFQ